MSYRIWTREELLSNRVAFSQEEAWRVVEAQHASSTMKLTDTLDEQNLLETLLEGTKPPIPPECAELHFLLFSPFRYAPYPHGSRFRRSGQSPGVFYCSERSATAIAELAFYRLLFFAESPDTAWPSNPSDYTAFRVEFSSDRAIDLRSAPFDAAKHLWEDLENYAACQAMESMCRGHDIDVIKYKSVRDPREGGNYALLRCGVFAKTSYTKLESWKLHLDRNGARAIREFPRESLEFGRAAFLPDRRIASINWDR